ncbi:MAG: sulfotransferase [Magnetococcales bacterium]|nr:sulfotransferase [Magnetococcales bacterium]
MQSPQSLDERLQGALARCRSHPQAAESLYDMISLLCEAGQLDVAESTLATFVDLHGQQAEFHQWLGQIAFLKNFYDRAVVCLTKALELDPERMLAKKWLGLACFQLDRYSQAIPLFREFLLQCPMDIQVENGLGVALAQSGSAQEGCAVLSGCVQRNPKNPALLTNLGDALAILGENGQAIACYRRALEADSRFGQAHSGLMSCEKYQDVDHPDLVRALEVVERGGLTAHDQAGIRFALGKAFNDCRSFDRAFEQYALGNDLRRKMNKPFNERVYGLYFQQIRETFSEAFFQQAKWRGSESQRPVLIVGMYRSGTSLVEQILSSHADVFGAGELLWLSQAAANLPQRYGLGQQHYPMAALAMTDSAAAQIASEYEAELIRVAGSADFRRIVDKMPHNYFYLGLLALLFPNARIIHCRRNPMDACLSIFFQDFTKNLSYTNTLSDLGRYYGLYHQLMLHWQAHLPLPILEVDYETLVANPEEESRRLIRYLDLPWDEACLQPHKKKRTVNTASHWQVRQAIHTQSKNRWKNYEKHLQPLIESLGPLANPHQT